MSGRKSLGKEQSMNVTPFRQRYVRIEGGQSIESLLESYRRKQPVTFESEDGHASFIILGTRWEKNTGTMRFDLVCASPGLGCTVDQEAALTDYSEERRTGRLYPSR